MKLLEAMRELEKLHETEVFDEIILKSEEEYMIVATDTFIHIPSLNVALFDMCYLQKNKYGDYEPDWAGTAFFIDGEFAGYESDDMATTFYNVFVSNLGVHLNDIDDAYVTDDYDAILHPSDEYEPELEFAY